MLVFLDFVFLTIDFKHAFITEIDISLWPSKDFCPCVGCLDIIFHFYYLEPLFSDDNILYNIPNLWRDPRLI